MLNIRGKYEYVHGKLAHRVILHDTDPRENESELEVHHIDGNKSNNDPSNLTWLTKSEHSRLHRLGDNHFPCSGEENANYRHGMCVGGQSAEYKKLHNHKTYMRHRDRRLKKQHEYEIEHRDHKRWYDKVRYWAKQFDCADTDARRNECLQILNTLRENPI